MDIEQVKKQAFELGIKDFFNLVRNDYLRNKGFETAEIDVERRGRLDDLADKVSSLFGKGREYLWEDERFHIVFRITSVDELASLGEGYDLDSIAESLQKGRTMSILPLNVILGNPTIRRFLPLVPELYSGKQRHSLDPYGIFANDHIDALVEAEESDNPFDPYPIVEKDGRRYKKIYLGSRKFDYAVLANLTENCPIGCAECYKGVLTRTEMAALADIDPKYADLKKQLGLQEKRAVDQVNLLTQWLNGHQEVNTVIFSGGEPFMYSPETIEKMLDEISKAEHVKEVRFCTGSVYLGLFSKMTDELIEKLVGFSRNNDGRSGRPLKRLYLNCDVADENQLLAPEAIMVTKRLNDAGLSLHLQMPLQEGINFFREDIQKTRVKLSDISRAAYLIGATPYKAIVNMHSPSFEELTVPIERVSEAITVFEGHNSTSDMERWQAYSILHEQGNAYVYAKPHFVFEKEVDKDRKRVTYFIPVGDSIHTYEEPLIAGINDRDSSNIADQELSSRIMQVRAAYHQLLQRGIDTRRFYEISGIRMAHNGPLIVSRQ